MIVAEIPDFFLSSPESADSGTLLFPVKIMAPPNPCPVRKINSALKSGIGNRHWGSKKKSPESAIGNRHRLHNNIVLPLRRSNNDYIFLAIWQGV